MSPPRVPGFPIDPAGAVAGMGPGWQIRVVAAGDRRVPSYRLALPQSCRFEPPGPGARRGNFDLVARFVSPVPDPFEVRVHVSRLEEEVEPGPWLRIELESEGAGVVRGSPADGDCVTRAAGHVSRHRTLSAADAIWWVEARVPESAVSTESDLALLVATATFRVDPSPDPVRPRPGRAGSCGGFGIDLPATFEPVDLPLPAAASAARFLHPRIPPAHGFLQILAFRGEIRPDVALRKLFEAVIPRGLSAAGAPLLPLPPTATGLERLGLATVLRPEAPAPELTAVVVPAGDRTAALACLFRPARLTPEAGAVLTGAFSRACGSIRRYEATGE